jgi:hypothetical protein
VKQTRKVFGGENRQEVEKAWRRNVPGEANPGKWTLNADDAVGTVKTPWKESTDLTGSARNSLPATV